MGSGAGKQNLHGFNGFTLSTQKADKAQKSHGIHQQSGRRCPGGKKQNPAHLRRAGRLGFPSDDDFFVLGRLFFFFNLKIHIPTST